MAIPDQIKTNILRLQKAQYTLKLIYPKEEAGFLKDLNSVDFEGNPPL